MSRTGVEAKPVWRAVPTEVRARVAETLGAEVTRAARVWGGYSPTPTFRLVLADGRGAFFKGTHRDTNDFAQRALVDEERAYRELAHLISPWAPRFYGAFRHEDWHVMLLEDAGPKSAPPWQPALTRQVALAYADYHASTLGADLPPWLPRPSDSLACESWVSVAEASEDFRAVIALAGAHSDAARDWLRQAFPLLARLSIAAADLPGPYALLHGDTRSDNLRFRDGRLILFDWPSVEVGRSELDLAAFAQSVTVEGGVEPEQVVAWYAERRAVDEEALDAMIVWIAAFFAARAWLPEVPGLPRLRRFQRQQLAVTLQWAARRLRLPEPVWTKVMASA